MTTYLIGFDGRTEHDNFVRLIDMAPDKIESYTKTLFKDILKIYFDLEFEGRGNPNLTKKQIPKLIEENTIKIGKGFKFPKNYGVLEKLDEIMQYSPPDVKIHYVEVTEQQKGKIEELKKDRFYNHSKQQWDETSLEFILQKI